MDAEGGTVGVRGWGLHAQVRVPLDAIDLDVDWRPESDRVAILGPSGSGEKHPSAGVGRTRTKRRGPCELR